MLDATPFLTDELIVLFMHVVQEVFCVKVSVDLPLDNLDVLLPLEVFFFVIGNRITLSKAH